MKSMTGFGEAFVKGPGFQAEIQIKTVNSRYADMKLSAPQRYRGMEPFFRSAASKLIKRGALFVYIERFPKTAQAPISIDWSGAEALKWKKLLQNLSQTLKVPQDLKASDFISLEGVVSVFQEKARLPAAEEKQIQAGFKKALAHVIQERKREGSIIQKDLIKQQSALSAISKSFFQLNEAQLKEQQKSLAQRAKALGPHLTEKSGDLQLEKEKHGFHEEAIRFQSHLKRLSSIFSSSKPQGKEIEFYAQELFRELNTICSKALRPRVIHLAVQGKTIVEKIKEQAQNIE